MVFVGVTRSSEDLSVSAKTVIVCFLQLNEKISVYYNKESYSRATDCGFAEGPRLTSSWGEEDGDHILKKTTHSSTIQRKTTLCIHSSKQRYINYERMISNNSHFHSLALFSSSYTHDTVSTLLFSGHFWKETPKQNIFSSVLFSLANNDIEYYQWSYSKVWDSISFPQKP